MTSETAQLLLELLDQVTLSASDPGLEDVARRLAAARRELVDVIGVSDGVG